VRAMPTVATKKWRPGGSAERRAAFAALVERWGEPRFSPPQGYTWKVNDGPWVYRRQNNLNGYHRCLWCGAQRWPHHVESCPAKEYDK
jgi:hypothetical protein